MKFSLNLIKFFLIKEKINYKNLINKLNINGFEVNSINNISNNIDSTIVLINNIKKIKENLFIFNIKLNNKKNIEIFIKYNIFKKNQYAILLKKKISKKYKYYLIKNNYIKIKFNKKIIGKKFNNILNKDKIIDISIPFNRYDCLSHLGISQEIKNINLITKKKVNNNKLEKNKKEYIKIKLINNNIYTNYCYTIIKNINLKIKIPIIIKNFLKNNSIKVKNDIRDIIEYIYLITGCNIHIIDLDKIKNGINLLLENKKNINNYIPVIKNAKNNKKIIYPNIENKKLVNKNTKNILIGCCLINYEILYKYKLNELIKKNFHKYIQSNDLNRIIYSIKYSIKLIKFIFGGKNKKIIIYNKNYLEKKIKININEIKKIIGIKIKNKIIIKAIKNIECKINYYNNKIFELSIPHYRTDLNMEEDFIKEIIKINNFFNKIKNNIEIENKINTKKIFENYNNFSEKIIKVKEFLINSKYNEVLNYSISNNIYNSLLKINYKKIKIKNPILKNNKNLRTSLIPGLIENLIYNIKKKEKKIKIFENGNCFYKKKNNFIEKNKLSSLISVSKEEFIKNIFINNIFINIKTEISKIIFILTNNKNIFFVKSKINFFIKNYCLIIKLNNHNIGYVGILNKNIFKKFLYKYYIIIYEINLNLLKIIKNNFFIEEKRNINISNKLLKMEKCISFLINKNINIEEIILFLYSLKLNKKINIELIDYYNIDNEINISKSITLKITIYSNKNITNDLINRLIKLYILKLKNKFYIKIR